MPRKQPPPHEQPVPFISPENLSTFISPENLPEARRFRGLAPESRKKEPPRDKPIKKRTQRHDTQAWRYRKRKYEALRDVCVSRSSPAAKGKQPDGCQL
jgi:hypothetical protein